ncbi:monooxygenase [Mactra antiquata]
MEETIFRYIDKSFISTLLVFICTLLLVYMNTRRRRNVPPGPPLLPIVGNLHSLMSRDTLGRLSELRRQYGDIFGLYMGNQLMIFLNGYDTIHDALVKKGSLFMFRAKPAYEKKSIYNTKGLIFSEGKLWKDGRQFALSALQEICFSDKRFLDNVIEEEIDHLFNTITMKENPVEIEQLLNSSVANVTFRIVYGHRFELNDTWLKWFQKTVRQFSENYVIHEVVLNCLPFIKHLPGDLLGLQKTITKINEIMTYLTQLIDNVKHNSNTEVEKQTCSFAGMYLEKIANDKDNEVESTFEDDNLKVASYHLIVAGSETTSTTIRWILLYLVRNPDIQEKIYSELLQKLGEDLPSVNDRKRLPYTNAVILEGIRISNVAPLAMPHTVTTDTMFNGFLIPEKSVLIPNLNSALMDPLIWDCPKEFRPERFMNETLSEVVVPKQFIAFSLGPRSCIGETLARIEIFLFVAGLVKKLKIYPEKDGILPDTEGILATTYNPKPFKIRVYKR